MTGKTHMAISAATTALALAARGVAASTGSNTVAGLLFVGILAGLFPDLDAPDTELQHLPHKAAKHIGRYMQAGMPRHSAPAVLVQGILHLVALPFGLIVEATGAVLRTFTGHRGFTHTLWGALTFTCLAAAVAFISTGSVHWSLSVGAVWLLGYASHLAADACTPSGIPLFGSASHPDISWRGQGMRARPMPARYHSSHVAAFHLLPRRMLIRTGTQADTLFVRWLSWAVFAAAMVPMLTAYP